MSAGLTEVLKRDSALSLDQAAVGCSFQVKALDGPECRQLREIGFCEEMRIRKLTNGHNMVCAVCGTRLALSRDLARQVRVEPLQ